MADTVNTTGVCTSVCAPMVDADGHLVVEGGRTGMAILWCKIVLYVEVEIVRRRAWRCVMERH